MSEKIFTADIDDAMKIARETEREYLSGKYLPSKSHRRLLNHRIRNKLQKFLMLELPIVQGSGVTDFGNTVTEFSNTTDQNIQFFTGEGGSRTPLDRLCRPTHNRSATSPQSEKHVIGN